MKKRYLILLWILTVFVGVLASSWWISKHPSHAAKIEEPKSPNTIQVAITGEVITPQIVDLPKGTTFRQALAHAGGVTPYSSRLVSAYTSVKEGSGHQLNLKSKEDSEKDPELVNGTVIVVPVQVMAEMQSSEQRRIIGKKKLDFEQIEKAIAPLFEATFALNFWPDRSKRLDVRHVHGRHYTLFSIQPPKEIPSHPSSTEKAYSYKFVIDPSLNPHLGLTPSALAFAKALSEVVDGELEN